MRRTAMGLALVVVAGLVPVLPAAAAPVHGDRQLTWQPAHTGTDSRLRGLAVINRNVAWAAGSGGTVLRTVDRGQSWQSVAPPGTLGFRFRDVEPFDADTRSGVVFHPRFQAFLTLG